jgi:hypothetical protein
LLRLYPGAFDRAPNRDAAQLPCFNRRKRSQEPPDRGTANARDYDIFRHYNLL